MATRTLTFNILGRDNLTSVLNKAGKSAQQNGNLISQSMKAAGQAMTGLGIAVTGVFGKAIADARAFNMVPLQQAAKNAKIAWDAFRPSVDAADASMAKLGFSGSQTNSALTKLVTVTGDSKASLSALNTVADLARYKHLSLADAATALGRAAAGNTRALRDLGISTGDLPPKFATTGDAASRMTTIVDLMSKKIGGQATAYAGTFGGKLDSLKAQMTNVSAGIGNALLPMLSSMIGWFSRTVVPIMQNKAAFATLAIGITAFAATTKVVMTLWATNMKAALIGSVVGIAILGLTVAITELLTHWNTVWGTMKNVVRTAGGAITTGFDAVKNFIINNFIRPVVNGILTFAGTIVHGIATAFGWIPGLGGKLKNAAKAFDDFKNSVNKSLDQLTGKTVNVDVSFDAKTGIATSKKTGEQTFNGYAYATGGRVRGPGTATSDSVPAYLSNDEYVVSASAHKHYGTGFLDALNAKKLAGGGVALNTHFPSMASVNKSIGKVIVDQATKWAQSFGSITGGGSGVSRWSSVILQALALLGQSSGWLGTVERRMNQESGGNPYAINLWDVNAKNGDPSRGLMQVIGATFAAYAGPFRSRGIYDPLANTFAGLNYALRRYGSLSALNQPGGYDLGGPLRPGYTLAYNGTGHNEYVVNPALGGSGGGDTYNITVPVTVQGPILGNQKELGRIVSDALCYASSHGTSMPWKRGF